MVKAQSVSLKSFIQGFFPGVPKRWMTDVVGQSEGFGQFYVESQCMSQRTRNLGYLKCVCQTAARVVG